VGASSLRETAPPLHDRSALVDVIRPVYRIPRTPTVLVVGGAGYIGSILAGALLDDGYNVTVLDPLLYGSDALRSLADRPGFELLVADTRDEEIVAQALTGVTAVVHCGEIVGDPACDLDPSVTLALNHTATVRLAEMAAQAGVERLIYPSSCSVYGATEQIVDERSPLNPVSLYGRLKVATEQAILALRTPTFHPIIFRLATVHGISPRPRFDLVVNTLAGRAASEGRITVQGGGQWRPFVHVADVAALLGSAVDAPLELVSGEVFNLGSNDQNFTIGEVAEIVRRHVPSAELDITSVVDRRNYRVAFDKVVEVLGFRPTRTVPDGIAEIVKAVQTRPELDVRDPRHSNVRALVETDARHLLWRQDRPEGDPAAPFRPRDVEVTRRVLRSVPRAFAEEAVS
jgi:nucleoside-diphosphate-sugar epimerase